MDEKILTERYQQGDPAAMAEIYEKYFSKVHATVLRMLDFRKSEDVTQEVFEQIFKAHKNFNGRCSLSTWIYRITVNQASKWRLKIKKFFSPSIDEIAEALSVDDNPEDNMIQKEETDFIRASIRELSSRQKEVVVLRAYQNLSYREVGQALGITENNAKTVHFKAIEKLRKIYFARYAT